jgi:hypothetical protein
VNLDEVDTDWVREQLGTFVSETQAINQSAKGYITSSCAQACGRDTAMQLSEVLYSILDRLYPEWSSEIALNRCDEFLAERDASKKLLARLDTDAEVRARLGSDVSPRRSAASLHRLIWNAAQTRWSTGHRHEAVMAAAKAVNSHLQTKVDRCDVSEADLFRQSFNEKAPEVGKPRLRFNAITDDQTRESMRQRVMSFGSGCFAAIRNPLGHLPTNEVDIDEQTALERLTSLSLLARWIDGFWLA